MPIEYLMWAPLVCTSLILYVTLGLGALFSIANSSWVSGSSRWLWAAAVILLPIAGAVLWLAASHRYNTAQRGTAHPGIAQRSTPLPDTSQRDGGTGGHLPSETGTADSRATDTDRTAGATTARGEESAPVLPVRRVRKSGGF